MVNIIKKFIKLILLENIIFFSLLFLETTNNINAKTKIKTKSTSRITFVLHPRRVKQLNRLMGQLVNSNSHNYHHYLSSNQFANRFGQSRNFIKQFTLYLKKKHLHSHVYKGNIIVSAYGSKLNLKKSLQLKKKSKNYKQNHFDRLISRRILGVAKTNEAGNFKIKSNFYQSKLDYGNGNSNNNIINSGPRKFINRYNVGPLYQNNQMGQGQSIGIISFANLKPSDAYYYWRQEGIPIKSNRLKMIQTGLNRNSWNQYDETTNDVEQAGSIAPKANINVYIGDTSAQGMINALATAISNDKEDSLSISWGQSEHLIQDEIKSKQIPEYYNEIINLLFKQANVEGMSVFSSSGDNGAYDSINENYYPKLSVDTPSSSPYVTSVGGTTLPYQISRKYGINKERAWSNDFLYHIFDNRGLMSSNQEQFIQNYFTGTGGGFSKINALPNYQKHIKGVGTYNAIPLWIYKNKTLYRIKNPRVVSGSSFGRNVPDISANADPNTGYVTYYSNHNHGNWMYTGGTSIVAPQMAAVAALINSKKGVKSGFWNPQIYRFAIGDHSPFHPLNDVFNNNNLYYTGQNNTVYNQSTGLGTVNVDKLNHLFNFSAHKYHK